MKMKSPEKKKKRELLITQIIDKLYSLLKADWAILAGCNFGRRTSRNWCFQDNRIDITECDSINSVPPLLNKKIK